MVMTKKLLMMTVMLAAVTAGKAQTATTHADQKSDNVMNINTKRLGAPIQSTMYGIFFEDINYAADGGLYGELVKNRSFEFPQHLMGWQAFGCVDIKDDGPFGRCPHYVVLSAPDHGCWNHPHTAHQGELDGREAGVYGGNAGD